MSAIPCKTVVLVGYKLFINSPYFNCDIYNASLLNAIKNNKHNNGIYVTRAPGMGPRSIYHLYGNQTTIDSHAHFLNQLLINEKTTIPIMATDKMVYLPTTEFNDRKYFFIQTPNGEIQKRDGIASALELNKMIKNKLDDVTIFYTSK